MAGKIGVTVHGMWSYIVKWIRDKQLIKGKLVTFSDNRLFSGNVYEKMGFDLERKVAKDYYWMKDGVRHHKSTLRKTGSETETVQRESEGYEKVWDIGKKKWSLVI